MCQSCLPAAAPEMRFASFQCQPQRFLVHVGDGQNFPRVRILNDGRNQAVGAEFRAFSRISFIGQYSAFSQIGFGLTDRQFAKMKDGCGQDGAGRAFGETLDKDAPDFRRRRKQ